MKTAIALCIARWIDLKRTENVKNVDFLSEWQGPWLALVKILMQTLENLLMNC